MKKNCEQYFLIITCWFGVWFDMNKYGITWVYYSVYLYLTAKSCATAKYDFCYDVVDTEVFAANYRKL